MIRISGKNFKNKVINIHNKVRPTKSIVKESVFNSITHYINPYESVFLDCFSGSGNMGIESVSYGFKTVFTEKFKSIYKILRSNLIECKIKFNEFKYSQIKKISDISSIDTNILVYSDIIKLLDYMNFKTDIIFIDPPYKSNLVDKIIYHKNFKNIIKQDTIIVYETSDSKFNPEKKFNIFNKKKFGKSFVYFFKIKI